LQLKFQIFDTLPFQQIWQKRWRWNSKGRASWSPAST